MNSVHFSRSPTPLPGEESPILTRFFSMFRSVLAAKSAVLKSVCKGRRGFVCQQPEEETRFPLTPTISAQQPVVKWHHKGLGPGWWSSRSLLVLYPDAN